MSHHDEEETASSRASEGGEETPSTCSQADSTSGFSGEDAELPPEDQLEGARREAAENYERYIRAKADIENILKRQSVDDLERALAHASDGSGSAVSGGVELVLKGLLAALKNNGVERVEASGKPFDPAEHEAVAMVETADAPPNTVMEVFRAGYKMRDRLLRAAMVSVSKAPAGQD